MVAGGEQVLCKLEPTSAVCVCARLSAEEGERGAAEDDALAFSVFASTRGDKDGDEGSASAD